MTVEAEVASATSLTSGEDRDGKGGGFGRSNEVGICVWWLGWQACGRLVASHHSAKLCLQELLEVFEQRLWCW